METWSRRPRPNQLQFCSHTKAAGAQRQRNLSAAAAEGTCRGMRGMVVMVVFMTTIMKLVMIVKAMKTLLMVEGHRTSTHRATTCKMSRGR